MLDQALNVFLDFLPFWAVAYGVNVFLYFATGYVLITIQNRHPERRIQPHRRGEKRMWKEIRQSVWSLTATSGTIAGGIFCSVRGYTFVEPLPLTWWSAILMFAISIFAFDTWFYWGHRLMHTKYLYRFHSFHHRSVAPTVWSTYSDDWIDAFAMQAYYLVAPLVLPIPPIVLIVHRLWDHFNGTIGHSGFEFYASPLSRMPSPMVCVTFHDQHHSRFKYNFANFFSFWDRLCGTIDPKYDETVKKFEAMAEDKEKVPAAE